MTLKEYRDLAKKGPHYNIEQLRKIASEHKLDITQAKTVEETQKAILDQAEEKLAQGDRDTLAKERLTEMEQQEKDRDAAKGPAPEPDEVTRTIRQINADFCREVPQELRNGGDVEKGHARFGGEYRVPDGVYRIEGSEWLYTFRGGRLKSVGRANPATKSDSYKSIANG